MDKTSAVSDGGPDPVASASAGKTPSHQHASRTTSKPVTQAPAAADTNTSSAATNGISTSPSKQSSASNSGAPSPNHSRDASPSRHVRKATSAGRLAGPRSRPNNQQESSPTRPSRSQIPTHTASTRSLSTSAAPALHPSSREVADPTATPAKNPALDLKDSHKWPVSPRLRSPQPNLPKPTLSTPLRSDPEPPAINVQQPSPAVKPVDSQPSPAPSESDNDEANSTSGVRTPVRGGLETVQEVATPAPDSDLADHVKEMLHAPEPQSDPALSDGGGHALRARPNLPSADSGSDSTASKADRRPTSVPPPPVARQSSAMSAKQGKSKPEGSTQTMTVETETVASIPQVALTTSAKADGANGTLKPKQSSETIKPKKDKKKTTRKQPSVSATSASKADNFEAKIASAVDEANTSDSEETFVYDSNPPDGGDRTVRRFHSRTPSATSMASQADRQNVRSIYGVMEGHHHGPVPKKSMKFVNTFNGSGNESLTTGDEDGKGTGRSAGGSGRGTTRHHHHIGRWGRQPGNGHPSLFDNESPFPNAAKSKLNNTPNSRNSSGATSPRNHLSTRGNNLTTKRSSLQMSSIYDMDDTGGADDERTPLIGSTRLGRSGRGRRGPHSLRQAESQTYVRRSSYLNRFAACLVLTMMFLLVITGAIGFMFATSQPMTDMEIVSIQKVVTSEQLLMFDVTVRGHNPNVVPVYIDHANLEIFAKSEHAGTDSDWWRSPNGPPKLKTLDDPANDPPTDPDEDSRPNILLGRITEFDSQLAFEGSLFHQGTLSSTAGMQLAAPGNTTSGGTKRWDLIYQNEFDLILKGVLKYTLPLSARVRSATVSGRTTVKPNSANDPSLTPNSTKSPHD